MGGGCQSLEYAALGVVPLLLRLRVGRRRRFDAVTVRRDAVAVITASTEISGRSY